MKIYDGGSDKDKLLIFVTGNSVPSPVTSLGNQMFIMFTTDSNGVGKGFTAKITFGNIHKGFFCVLFGNKIFHSI